MEAAARNWCPNRRQLMEAVVLQRRHLAASLAAYRTSLRDVSSAFSRFAVGKPIRPVSNHRRRLAAAARTGGVVRHYNLSGVAVELAESFIQTSVAGSAVSWLLKGGCLHKFLGAIWGFDSMSTTLQQLLVLEKKLCKYKVRPLRIKRKRNNVAMRGKDRQTSSWNKRRLKEAATLSAINNLRNHRLRHQVVNLHHATLDMWRAMQRRHEAQARIVQQLPELRPTTEIPREATQALLSAVGAWGVALRNVIRAQGDYVRAVHEWLRQSGSDNGITTFADRWGNALDSVDRSGKLERLMGSFALNGRHSSNPLQALFQAMATYTASLVGKLVEYM